jgi:hypothetical protein
MPTKLAKAAALSADRPSQHALHFRPPLMAYAEASTGLNRRCATITHPNRRWPIRTCAGISPDFWLKV